MKITARSKGVPIENIDRGAVFEYDGEFYMKVQASQSQHDWHNVVDLSTGWLSKFADGTLMHLVESELFVDINDSFT